MKRTAPVKRFLWTLASFDSYIMSFCPTICNHMAGIGMFYLLQLIVAFTAGYLLCQLFCTACYFIGIGSGLLVALLVYKWIRVSSSYQHKRLNARSLLLLLLAVVFVSFFIGTIFNLILFEPEITYQLYIQLQPIGKSIWPLIWQLPYGLYHALWHKGTGLVVRSICTSVYAVTFLLFCLPYILTYQARHRSYFMVLNKYTNKFCN